MAFIAAPLSGIYDSNRPVSGTHAALVYAAAGLFAVTFAALNLFPDQNRNDFPRWFWALITLWFVGIFTFLSYYDAGYWAYLYIFCLFPLIRLTHKGPQSVLGLVSLTALVTATSGLGAGNIWGPVATVGGGGLSAIAFWRLTTTNDELRKARDDLAQVAVADERLRFARDLHDLLGHSLSVITLKSEVAGRLLPDSPERARTEVAEIEAIAREALREVRDAVTGYRQATVPVEVAGARAALAAAGIAWSEDIQSSDLAPELEGPLAWAVREGVTNVIRHSGARHCRLTIRPEGNLYVATVTDDGAGLPGNLAAGGAGAGGGGGGGAGGGGVVGTGGGGVGNGLRGLSERLSLAGGTLEAGPLPGGGFRLRAAVPRSAPAAPVEAVPGLSCQSTVPPVPAGAGESGSSIPSPIPSPGSTVEASPAGIGQDRR